MGQRWYQPFLIVENLENEAILADRDWLYISIK